MGLSRSGGWSLSSPRATIIPTRTRVPKGTWTRIPGAGTGAEDAPPSTGGR